MLLLFFFLGVEKGGICFFVQQTLFKWLQIANSLNDLRPQKVPVSVPLGDEECAGTQGSHLTWQTGRQRNSYKVRVAAFSAIFVLFEFRWVMRSCCLSARLSLGHPSLPLSPPFFFTRNCQMSPIVTWKSFWVRCCLQYFRQIKICISSRRLAKYQLRLEGKIILPDFFVLFVLLHSRLSKSVRILLWKASKWRFVQASNY